MSGLGQLYYMIRATWLMWAMRFVLVKQRVLRQGGFALANDSETANACLFPNFLSSIEFYKKN
jgi:hypothetical protein